jgi:hypothetical protein
MEKFMRKFVIGTNTSVAATTKEDLFNTAIEGEVVEIWIRTYNASVNTHEITITVDGEAVLPAISLTALRTAEATVGTGDYLFQSAHFVEYDNTNKHFNVVFRLRCWCKGTVQVEFENKHSGAIDVQSMLIYDQTV